MSIFDRVRRIVKANLNWLLNQAEPAENELEAKIKDLEETIHEGRESAAMYGASYKRLQNEMEQLQRQQAALEQQASQALQAGDEQQARKLIQEKVKVAERSAQLEPGVEKGRQTFESLRDQIVKLQDQLRQAKTKLLDLQARKRTAEAQNAFDRHLGGTDVSGLDGVAFERLEDDVLTSEAEVEIRQQIRGDSLFDHDLTERSREIQVDAELEALKQKLEQASGED